LPPNAANQRLHVMPMQKNETLHKSTPLIKNQRCQHSLPNLSHRTRLPDFDKNGLGQSAALALLGRTTLPTCYLASKTISAAKQKANKPALLPLPLFGRQSILLPLA